MNRFLYFRDNLDFRQARSRLLFPVRVMRVACLRERILEEAAELAGCFCRMRKAFHFFCGKSAGGMR